MDIRPIRAHEMDGRAFLLKGASLSEPQNADMTLGAFDDAGRLVGCCSLVGDMLQGLAVDPTRQGEGVVAPLITAMLKHASARGIRSLSVITKPDAAPTLASLGFRRVASAEPYAAFLEFGPGGIEPYLSDLRARADGKPQPRAAVVLNANPFTLGHLHLLGRACAESAWVFAMVVEEELSEFPFADRFALVRTGAAHLANLSVLPGGRYIVSTLTFPSYFIRDAKLAAAEGALDAALFAQRIAPALGVSRRYVGAEPLSASTDEYNRQLKDRLPREGIELIELSRLASGGAPVSASRVREMLHRGELNAIRGLVPDTTFQYLSKAQARRGGGP